MKAKRIIRQIFSRMIFILAFLALCSTVICLSLGIFSLPAIELPWSTDPVSSSEAETTVKGLETGEYVPGSSTRTQDTGTSSPDPTSVPGTTVPGSADTTSGGSTPDEPSFQTPLLSDLLSEGYKLSWGTWNKDMKLARVFRDGFLPTVFTAGNTMQERGVSSVSYQSAGIEFNSFVTVSSARPSVDLYMGYVIIDSGTGTGTDIFAGTTETKNADGSVTVHRKDRQKQTGVRTLTIYGSGGKPIGTYIASKIIPANTRDRENRPLFWYADRYYYIDESSGDFILSDYVDERDSRGLYFDYNPDYGMPDSNVYRYDIFTDITQKFTINSYYVYTRNQIDVRLARQLYIDFPSYAKTVSNHNATFKHFYTIAKAEVDEERKHTTAVITTTSPAPSTTEAPTVITTLPEQEITTQSAQDVTAESVQDITSGLPATEPEITGSAAAESGSSLTPPVLLASPAAEAESADVSSDAETSAESPDVPAVTSSPEVTEETSLTSDAEITADPEPTEPETTKKNYTLNVSITYPAYRFGYGKAQPKVDLGYVTTMKYTVAPYVSQSGSWASSYKYAQAYNFREGRALTVDDNGVVRIINTSGSSVIYDNSYVKPEYYSGGQLHRYYILPSARGVNMLGHFYYDHGLIRLVRAQTNYLATNAYYSREDLLLDTSGKIYDIPSGFTLVSYSEGILILEKSGQYGCYHKDGYWVADPIYTSAQPFIEGLCVLSLSDGTCGAIDTEGRVVIPFAYKSITNASSGLVACFSEAEGWTVFAKTAK